MYFNTMKSYIRTNSFNIIVFRKLHFLNIFWNSINNTLIPHTTNICVKIKPFYKKLILIQFIHYRTKITHEFLSFSITFSVKNTFVVNFDFRIIPNRSRANLCLKIKLYFLYKKPRLKYIFPEDIRIIVQKMLDKKVPKI